MRDTTLLHPKLQEIIPTFLYKCECNGLKVKITETVRTVGEQNDLYAQGRTRLGVVVTNAKGEDYSSMHQWGVAFDVCRNDGKGAYNNSDGWFEKVGEIGESLGLEWGGRWQGFIDRPHFQLKKWGSTTNKLKELYEKPDVFKKSWGQCNLPNYANITVAEMDKMLICYKATKMLQKKVGMKLTGHPSKKLIKKCPFISKWAYEDYIKIVQMLLTADGIETRLTGVFDKQTEMNIFEFKKKHKFKKCTPRIKAGGRAWKILLKLR